MIKMTRQLLESGRTPKGGFSKMSLNAIGVTYPLKKHWTDSVLSSTYRKDRIIRFLNHSGKHHVSIDMNEKEITSLYGGVVIDAPERIVKQAQGELKFD